MRSGPSVAMVTGAAGQLGRAVAELFARQGLRRVLVGRSLERLQEAHDALGGSPDHLVIGGVDLTEPEPARSAAARAVARFGRIDVLVNAVGAFRGAELMHEQSLSAWDELYQVNVRTVVNACRAVVPHMISQRHGRIVNVASIAALAAERGTGAYSASKAAVVRLTESLAAELAGSNITVNAVLPDTMDTPANREAMPGADFTRWVTPAAVAAVIAFLVGDAGAAVNGAALPVLGRSLP